MSEKLPDSRDVARAAIALAMTVSREDEATLKKGLTGQRICGAASDFGGDFVTSVMKIIERAVVIAKREGIIGEMSHEEGAVAGAAHDAVMQVIDKAMGLIEKVCQSRSVGADGYSRCDKAQRYSGCGLL